MMCGSPWLGLEGGCAGPAGVLDGPSLLIHAHISSWPSWFKKFQQSDTCLSLSGRNMLGVFPSGFQLVPSLKYSTLPSSMHLSLPAVNFPSQ